MVNRPVFKNGNYLIKGKKYPNLIGSRKMVFTHKTAYKTTGGLTRRDLMQNKNNEIVSRKKHFTAKKEKRLVKYGYATKKGEFGYVLITPQIKSTKSVKRNKSSKRKSSMKGGNNIQPANFNLNDNFKSIPAQL